MVSLIRQDLVIASIKPSPNSAKLGTPTESLQTRRSMKEHSLGGSRFSTGAM